MQPFDEFAQRIVRNAEYQEIVDAIVQAGGDLSQLVLAVNRHRYTAAAAGTLVLDEVDVLAGAFTRFSDFYNRGGKIEPH